MMVEIGNPLKRLVLTPAFMGVATGVCVGALTRDTKLGIAFGAGVAALSIALNYAFDRAFELRISALEEEIEAREMERALQGLEVGEYDAFDIDMDMR